MYRPKYIKIQNIGTFSDFSYDFKVGKSQIIQGKNLDDKGQKSNGVGKSFFIDSIAFSITGLVLSGRTLEELINDKEETAYIELCLINNSDELLVKRYLSRKKPQLIEIFKNGVPKHVNESDVNQRNQFIIDEIGISKEDLFKFFLISKDRYKPYFKLSDNEKKEITVRFSNADKIDEVFPIIERDITHEEVTLKNINNSIIKLQSQKEAYEKVINDWSAENSLEAKEKLKEEYQNKIDLIEKDIEQSESKLIDLYSSSTSKSDEVELKKSELISKDTINLLLLEIEKVNEIINGINGEMDADISIKDNEISKLEETSKELRRSISVNNNLKADIESQITKIKSKLSSSIECPKCSYEFILKSNNTVEELKVLLVENENLLSDVGEIDIDLRKQFQENINKIETIRQEIISIRKKYDDKFKENRNKETELNKSLSDSENFNRKIYKEIGELESYLLDIDRKIKLETNNINDCKKRIEIIEQDILDLSKKDDSNTIQKYQNLIVECEQQLKDENEKLLTQQEKIQGLNSWVLKFKSFKSYLANLSLKNIEYLINSFLQKMNTDLSVEIEGYKQKGKKITEKITESVLRNGFRVGSYSRFSGGERGRIDIGSILANQTLINNNASPKGLDLILIDEVLESLDSAGIEGIIKSMDNIDKTMLLITQNEINSLPNQTLTFIKKNGVTNGNSI